jgi:hypothetical protein
MLYSVDVKNHGFWLLELKESVAGVVKGETGR